MSDELAIIKDTLDNFKKIQYYILLAKEENAEKTYSALKEEYYSLKTLLNFAGINLADIDKINE